MSWRDERRCRWAMTRVSNTSPGQELWTRLTCNLGKLFTIKNRGERTKL